MVETTTASTDECRDCGSTDLYGVAHTEIEVNGGQVNRVSFTEIQWKHLWCSSCGSDIIHNGERV